MSLASHRSWVLGLGLGLMSGCADDEVMLPDHVLVGHYSTSWPLVVRDGLSRFDIRPGNVVFFETVDGCGEYVAEATYAWEAVSDDKIRITAIGGGWIDGTYKIDVSSISDCDQVLFSYYTAEWPLYDMMLLRGRLCLFASGVQCVVDWCEDEPIACE